MLTFAYGSNLDWKQMKKRCPSACFVCIAKLKDHQLAFSRKSKERKCGVADVISENGSDVWGVVYKIDETDIGSLDKAEDFKPGRPKENNSYIREKRHVYAEGDEKKPLLVSIYVANVEKDPPLPNTEYKNLIVNGAKFWHLPEKYIETTLTPIKTAKNHDM